MSVSIHQKAGFLRDAVFAANDGVITTFAVVAGAAGASLSSTIVLILGFANLFADGFSMAAGNYLGVKSEIEFEEARGKSWEKESSPFRHGVVTFIFFNLAGLLPLLPFLFRLEWPFQASTILVGFSLLGVGIGRSFYTRKNAYRSVIETFMIGGLAAFVAFFVGFLVDKYVV